MNTHDLSTGTDGANPTQNAALGFAVAFLVALFLILALPLVSGSESVLSQAGGGEMGPFFVVVAVTIGLAFAGRRSPLAAGVASGIIVLISIALALTTTIVILLASILDEFVEYDFGGGMWAVVAASVFGFASVILSAQNWRGLSPPTWTPVAVIGAVASVAMIGGLAIPEEGFTLGYTLGFDAHPVVGIAFTAFLVSLALVGVAGFAFGRWGVGLLAGFIGYILVGWVTSTSQDQSTAFGWSGVTTGIDFHPVTVFGFWTATAMFAIHAVQQLSGRVAATSTVSSTVPSDRAGSVRPSPVPATWALDPYGHGHHRYWNGRSWTTKVSDSAGNVHDAPTTLRPLAGAVANWYPDPLQRYEHRYFDGTTWTERVATAGEATTDRPRADAPATEADVAPPPPPAPAPQPAPALQPAAPVAASAPPALSTPPVPVSSSSPIVRFADGTTHALANTLIIGRSPAPVAEFPGAELVQVDDITVSKTHAAVGRHGSAVWVRDLHSSNGVTVDDGAGERPAEPGQDVVLVPGTRVVLGDDTHFVVEIEPVESTIPRAGLQGPR